MKVRRIDHIGINVNDLAAAKAFFLELGLEVEGEYQMEGKWLDGIVGLEGVRTEMVMLGTPDGETSLELVKYVSPVDESGLQPSSANTLGIRHIAIAVDDIEGVLARLKKVGAVPFNEIYNYEGIYKLCYVRGPEGIILELAEKIS
ncbi:VOC family protein [Luteolibacter sp. LG18]|uniref:VOC family protein n=1 Tax=Luteolibacter sp. LG18 TaxID=2819286 RepID=UPI002B2F65B5|nr:glyoxalase [Luteolibacter sp. LG18]